MDDSSSQHLESFLSKYFGKPYEIDLKEQILKYGLLDFDIDEEDFERFVVLPFLVFFFEGRIDDEVIKKLIQLVKYNKIANELDDKTEINPAIDYSKVGDEEVRKYLEIYNSRKMEMNHGSFTSYSLKLQKRYSLLGDFLLSQLLINRTINSNLLNGIHFVILIIVLQKMLDDLADLRNDYNMKKPNYLFDVSLIIPNYHKLSPTEQKRIFLINILPSSINNIMVYYRTYLEDFELIKNHELKKFLRNYSKFVVEPVLQVNSLLTPST